MITINDSCNEVQILDLLSKDSEYALELLYKKHCSRIYKLAMRYLKSAALAEEVVQDVFMKLWLHRKEIKPGSSVEPWLFVVSKNNILNRLKKIAHEWKAFDYIKKVQPGADNSLQEKIQDSEYQIVFEEALKCLSEQQLQVFNLAREENLSYVEIAKHLDISPLTVKTHMSRALDKIRTTLNSNSIICSQNKFQFL